MRRSKRAEEWNRHYFELSEPDKQVLRNMALVRLQQKQRVRRERVFTFVTLQSEPLILGGDRRDPARSRPELGRRLGDIARHGGAALSYAVCLPLSSFAMQPLLTEMAQASNATHNPLLVFGNLGFSIGAMMALWLAFILGARFHVRRMEQVTME